MIWYPVGGRTLVCAPMLDLCREALSAETFKRCMWDNPERLYDF